ncbi:hypothetical protein RvY_11534 [Ramazzottius varieornatus]|uniref:Uncharacterized protein n=1 Tax=Ramazzottius varieornatus TaxID=947166 RepID=A0A1D1VLU0_RAMVA|nr:hypothetical protein RvY_11534 [Ramazzottius varieornatus]
MSLLMGNAVSVCLSFWNLEKHKMELGLYFCFPPLADQNPGLWPGRIYRNVELNNEVKQSIPNGQEKIPNHRAILQLVKGEGDDGIPPTQYIVIEDESFFDKYRRNSQKFAWKQLRGCTLRSPGLILDFE